MFSKNFKKILKDYVFKKIQKNPWKIWLNFFKKRKLTKATKRSFKNKYKIFKRRSHKLYLWILYF